MSSFIEVVVSLILLLRVATLLTLLQRVYPEVSVN